MRGPAHHSELVLKSRYNALQKKVTMRYALWTHAQEWGWFHLGCVVMQGEKNKCCSCHSVQCSYRDSSSLTQFSLKLGGGEGGVKGGQQVRRRGLGQETSRGGTGGVGTSSGGMRLPGTDGGSDCTQVVVQDLLLCRSKRDQGQIAHTLYSGLTLCTPYLSLPVGVVCLFKLMVFATKMRQQVETNLQ